MRINRPATKAGAASTTSALPATSRAGWQCHDGLRQYRYYCTHPLLSLLIINTTYPYPPLLIAPVYPIPLFHLFLLILINDPSFGSSIHTQLEPFPCGLLEADASSLALVVGLNPHSSNAGPCASSRLPWADAFIDTCIFTSAFGAGVDRGDVDADPLLPLVPSMVVHLASEASGVCITRCAWEVGVDGAVDRGDRADRCGSIAGLPAGPATDRHTHDCLAASVVALGSRRSTRRRTDDFKVSAAFITRCAPSIRRSCTTVGGEGRSA